MIPSLYNEPNQINDLLRAAHPSGGTVIVNVPSPNGGDGIVHDTIENQLHKIQQIYKYKAATLLESLANDLGKAGDLFVAREVKNIRNALLKKTALSESEIKKVRGDVESLLQEMEVLVNTHANLGLLSFVRSRQVNKFIDLLNDIRSAVNSNPPDFEEANNLFAQISPTKGGQDVLEGETFKFLEIDLHDLFEGSKKGEAQGLAAFQKFKSRFAQLGQTLESAASGAVVNQTNEPTANEGENKGFSVDTPVENDKGSSGDSSANKDTAPAASSEEAIDVSPVLIRAFETIIGVPAPDGKLDEQDVAAFDAWISAQEQDEQSKYNKHAKYIIQNRLYATGFSTDKVLQNLEQIYAVLAGRQSLENVKDKKEDHKRIFEISFKSPLTGTDVVEWDFASVLTRAQKTKNPFFLLRALQGVDAIPEEWKDEDVVPAAVAGKLDSLFMAIQSGLREAGVGESEANNIISLMRFQFEQMEDGQKADSDGTTMTVIEWCSALRPEYMKDIRTSTEAMKSLIQWFFTYDYGTKSGIVNKNTAKNAEADITGAIIATHKRFSKTFGGPEKSDPAKAGAGNPAANSYENVGQGERANVGTSPWVMLSKKYTQTGGKVPADWWVSLTPGSKRWETYHRGAGTSPPPPKSSDPAINQAYKNWYRNNSFWNSLSDEQRAAWLKSPQSNTTFVADAAEFFDVKRPEAPVQEKQMAPTPVAPVAPSPKAQPTISPGSSQKIEAKKDLFPLTIRGK